jgi:hypothetical protein
VLNSRYTRVSHVVNCGGSTAYIYNYICTRK